MFYQHFYKASWKKLYSLEKTVFNRIQNKFLQEFTGLIVCLLKYFKIARKNWNWFTIKRQKRVKLKLLHVSILYENSSMKINQPGPNAKSISVLGKSKSKSYSITDSELWSCHFFYWQSKSKFVLKLGKSNPSLI